MGEMGTCSRLPQAHSLPRHMRSRQLEVHLPVIPPPQEEKEYLSTVLATCALSKSGSFQESDLDRVLDNKMAKGGVQLCLSPSVLARPVYEGNVVSSSF